MPRLRSRSEKSHQPCGLGGYSAAVVVTPSSSPSSQSPQPVYYLVPSSHKQSAASSDDVRTYRDLYSIKPHAFSWFSFLAFFNIHSRPYNNADMPTSSTPLDTFPIVAAAPGENLIRPMDSAQISEDSHGRRRRKSSGLPDDPRGDTGAMALSTLKPKAPEAAAAAEKVPSPRLSLF